MSLHLTAVVAMTPDRVIGKAGKLPWHLPEDLKYFKRVTMIEGLYGSVDHHLRRYEGLSFGKAA